MSEKWQPGDVVRVKNQPGSPKMTVNNSNPYGTDIECVWFTRNDTFINAHDEQEESWAGPFRGSFHQDVLEDALEET